MIALGTRPATVLSAPAAALELALVVAELLAPALDDADDDDELLLLLPHPMIAMALIRATPTENKLLRVFILPPGQKRSRENTSDRSVARAGLTGRQHG
ncbi:MAG: hypothetical protein M3Y09_08065 [Actinomycetota bacterium]|nr:hypothetical protein [Actinomycetota bacterium]